MRPPTSAWEADTGRPILVHMKIYSTEPSSAARITYTSMQFWSTIPFPIVAATVVSNMNIAIKIQNAAQATATLGGRAFVAITDAMQFAASFIPLVKLNNSAMTAVTSTIATIS